MWRRSEGSPGRLALSRPHGYVSCFLSPFQGLLIFPLATHDFRRGLRSFAALRLRWGRLISRIKAGNFRTCDLRAGFFWLLYNPR